MTKIRKLFGSMYLRFLAAFLGAFLLSIVIAYFFISATQFSNAEKMMRSSLNTRAAQLRSIVQNQDISVEKAIRYLSNDEFKETVFSTYENFGFQLNNHDRQKIDSNQLVIKINTKGRLHVNGVFKLKDKYIVITPSTRSNPISLFFSMQRIMIIIPIILGTILIFFVTITVVRPLRKISEASKKVAAGNFDVALSVKGHHEIADLTKNFNRMVKELSANEYLHKDFVSNVSHEFKTPITSLKGYAKLLRDKELSEEKRREYAEIIVSESDRLANLSSNLLRLSELENQTFNLKKESFSLDEQIRDSILLLQNDWEKKNLDLDLSLEEVSFTGDKHLLYQAWINLISNAIKYSDHNGEIKIVLKKEDVIKVQIIDQGAGISEEDMQNIFLRFYKSDKARNTAGTGLGLSIVKKIIDLHGGTIQVQSEENAGSRFTVCLPFTFK